MHKWYIRFFNGIRLLYRRCNICKIFGPNSNSSLSQDMATTLEIRSHTSILESNLRVQRSAKRLQFVAISNPNELKNRKNKKTIKRHVGLITSKHGFKHRTPVSRVFELPVSHSLSNSDSSKNPGIASSDPNHLTNIIPKITGAPQSIQPLEHGMLSNVPRTLGIGPGLNPLLNLPIEFNPRNSQLFDFCMHSLLKYQYLC
jgi:hypothetical protein